MNESDKHLLTRSQDRISFLYVEMARIEQTEYGVEIVQEPGRTEVPITTISCLILGPGVSITHRAVENIAKAGCSICWTGRDMTAFYAYGEPVATSSKNILLQAKYHESKLMHMQVVREMYSIRYPGERIKTKSLEELRGIEGQHVKKIYEQNASQYHVLWNGRSYKTNDFHSQDVPNQYLTALHHILYAIVQSVIVTMGFSPAIGFVHTGKMQSFVYDMADLYKERLTIPLAFRLSAQYGAYNRKEMLRAFRAEIVNFHLMQAIADDLKRLFQGDAKTTQEITLQLWDYGMMVKAGVNYGKARKQGLDESSNQF